MLYPVKGFRLDPDLVRDVELRALAEGTSQQEIASRALRAYLETPLRVTGEAD